MATKKDKIKWELYKKKKHILILWGLKNGFIFAYNEKLIENLRNVYYGGIPGSVLLLCRVLCDGHCYDRSVLITLGFGDDDFNVINAHIDGIRLNPKYIDKNVKYPSDTYDSHSFAERILSDGSSWIYDTSLGLVFDKRLYWLIEKPRIIKVNDKQATMNFCEWQDIKNADIEKDKYVLPLVLPMIEGYLDRHKELYEDYLKREIELLKKKINYSGLCQEIEEDMNRIGLGRRRSKC